MNKPIPHTPKLDIDAQLKSAIGWADLDRREQAVKQLLKDCLDYCVPEKIEGVPSNSYMFGWNEARQEMLNKQEELLGK